MGIIADIGHPHPWNEPVYWACHMLDHQVQKGRLMVAQTPQGRARGC